MNIDNFRYAFLNQVNEDKLPITNQCRLVKKIGTLITQINTDLHGFHCA